MRGLSIKVRYSLLKMGKSASNFDFAVELDLTSSHRANSLNVLGRSETPGMRYARHKTRSLMSWDVLDPRRRKSKKGSRSRPAATGAASSKKISASLVPLPVLCSD